MSVSVGHGPDKLRANSERATRAVYTITIFLSALLLFAVQPMLTKMVLPTLGGSPSVWAVSLCFFQGALLLGYCYAYLLNRVPSAKGTVVVHLALLAASCLALPIALPANATTFYAGGSYLWLVLVLAMAVGLPFVGIAASAPVLQSWFARTGDRDAHEPYFLYRASNAGSLVGLIGYPILFEPTLALSAQSTAWSAGFVLLALMVVLCGSRMVGRGAPPQIDASNRELAPRSGAVGWTLRLAWAGWAFVPSGLLVAFTTYLTTDVASAPFLWIVPLAVYLVTFIVVFRPSQLLGERSVETLQPLVVVVAILGQSDLGRAFGGLLANSAIGLAAFVTTCLVCHRRLYLQRPAASHLTEFYMWMSLGGVLGGIFSAILAPQVFSTPIEYPLLLALGLAWRLRVPRPSRKQLVLLATAMGIAVTAALGVAFVWGVNQGVQAAVLAFPMVAALGVGTLVVPAFVGLQLALVTLTAALAATVLTAPAVYSARGFFGVHRVIERDDFRQLLHGTTLHGAQRLRTREGLALDSTERPLAVSYFHSKSAFALGLELTRASFRSGERPVTVGIVGLGTGAMACHARPGERWRFFEIDPLVVDIAKNPRLFNYLSSCIGNADIVMGDARITLARERKAVFDYLLIDGFNSDAIPIHLLTVDALQLYLEKLSDNGVLALHISNRHLDLASVVAANVNEIAGLQAVYIGRSYSGTRDLDALSAHVVLISRHREVLAPASNRADALPLRTNGASPWTDDFSNVVSALVRRYFSRLDKKEERTPGHFPG